MSLSRTSTILALSAGVLAVALLFQQHSIQSLRKENSLLRTQDEQLALMRKETNSSSLDSDTLRRLESVRIENEARLLQEATLLKELQAMPKETLTKVLPTAITDPLLNELLRQLDLLEQSKIALQRNVADDDTSVLTVTRQIESVERKIAERTEGIMKGMEVRVASLKAQLDSLASSIENAKELK